MKPKKAYKNYTFAYFQNIQDAKYSTKCVNFPKSQK